MRIFCLICPQLLKAMQWIKSQKFLDKNNHNNYLIDIGGELIVRGSKLGNSWVVGVQNPSSLINDAIFTIES